MRDDLDLSRAEIFRGRQHRLVFLELKEQALMVSEIMRKINTNLKNKNELRLREVSRALKWLFERDYAVCLNPTDKKGERGILYKLSTKGKKIRKIWNE